MSITDRTPAIMPGQYRVEWAALVSCVQGIPPASSRVPWHYWFVQDSLHYLPPCTTWQAWRILDSEGRVAALYHPRLEVCRRYSSDGKKVALRPHVCARPLKPEFPPAPRVYGRPPELDMEYITRPAVAVLHQWITPPIGVPYPTADAPAADRFAALDFERECAQACIPLGDDAPRPTVGWAAMDAAIHKVGSIAAFIRFTTVSDRQVAQCKATNSVPVTAHQYNRIKMLSGEQP